MYVRENGMGPIFLLSFLSLLFSPDSLDLVQQQRGREAAGGGAGTAVVGEGERWRPARLI
jgi:hypothetical protein